MNNSQIDIKNKAFSWSMIHNLHLIIKFHNEQHQMMKNQVSTINRKLNSCNDKDERKKLLIANDIYNNTFKELLKRNIFLMLYSQLEEYLYHVWKIYAKEQTVSNSGSLKRYNKIMRSVLSKDLGQVREWNLLCDYEKVRNCILHANGRMSILRNKNDLEIIINKSNGQLNKKKDRIELAGEYLESFVNTIESLIKLVEKAANRKSRML